MKKALNSILAILLAVVMTASIVASGVVDAQDLPPANNAEFTESERKDEDKEPDCNPNCEGSWLDMDGDEY